MNVSSRSLYLFYYGRETADMKGHPLFAACYDTLNRATEKRLLGRLRADLLAPLGGRVPEIGLGTGANLAYYPREVEVIAIEPDPYMLRRAIKTERELQRARR